MFITNIHGSFLFGSHLLTGVAGESINVSLKGVIMRRPDTRVKPHIFILSIFLMIAMGNKIVPAWELDKPSMTKGNIKTALINYQKPLPSIKELRRRIKEKRYNFTMDETWVYKLPPEESNALLGTIPAQIDERRLKKIPHMAGLPSYFDWRDRNMVAPVRDQHPCGLCWAFTAVAEFWQGGRS